MPPQYHASVTQAAQRMTRSLPQDVTVEFHLFLRINRKMEMEITLPDEVPVMTLHNVAFFPQALMPLHIFEPRYRDMLRDVLATNRLFAVAGLDVREIGSPGKFEPPHRIASVGIIRACQKNQIVRDEPYRRIRIRALSSQQGASPGENGELRRQLARLIHLKLKLAATTSSGLATFLKTVDDPEAFVDIAAFSLCENSALKQKLLETLDVHRRLEIFGRALRTEIDALKLKRKLQGPLRDEDVSNN
jgi:Lon protease-like protein